jgi:uncharacterized membrane protein HdeD (DUF308 family)
MLEKIKNVKWGYIIIGLLLFAIGICFIAFNNSLKWLAIAIGVILSAFGTVFGVVTVANKKRGFSFAVKIIFSIICLASGIITAIFNENSVDILIAVFCLLLIVDGSFKLNTSAMAKRYSVWGWWIMLSVSVLVIASAFALAKYTPEKTSTATLLLGLTTIIDAVANLFSTVWASKYETAQKAEIYYEVHNSLNDGSL